MSNETETPEVHTGLPATRESALVEEGRELSPEEFLRRRNKLIRLVKAQLVEAHYDERGNIVRVNDYYKVPGTDKLALSRPGAGKLSDIYRVKPIDQQTQEHVYEREHVMYRLVTYVGRYGQVFGVGTGSCSTSEKRFLSAGSRKKYGAESRNGKEVTPPDFRAADHDVLTMAAKRGYVNAIIDALSAHEVLQAADELRDIPEGEGELISEEVVQKPATNGGPTSQQLVRAFELLEHPTVTDKQRSKFVKWVQSPKCTFEKMEDQLHLLEDRIAEVKENGAPF